MEKKQSLRIIVIDDNPTIHQDFIKILTNKKSLSSESSTEKETVDKSEDVIFPEFEIDTASEIKTAVEKIKRALHEKKPYALAFVNPHMQQGSHGIETIKQLWKADKNLQVVICATYTDASWEDAVEELEQTDNLLVLKKPFDNIAIRQLASALTKKWQLFEETSRYSMTLEEKIAERTESLEKSLSLMRAALEPAADGVLIVNNTGSISDYNNKFLEMWHIKPSIAAKNDFSTLLKVMHEQIQDFTEFNLTLKQLNTRPDEVIVGYIKCKDKRIFEYYTQPHSLNNKVVGRAWSFRDITKRTVLEVELQYQAMHDVLTGLPNRILLQDSIKQAVLNADRKDTIFGVLFLDLDKFKLVNDSLSYEAGDKILRAVARRLKSVIREHDILARLGGDEFVVVTSPVRDANDLVKIAHKLLLVFNNPFNIDSHEVMLTASVGICVYPKDGRHDETLLRNANTAMYAAKALGPNQFQFYADEFLKRNMNRVEREAELRLAIKENQFFLHYQPQFDLNSEKLVSVEALIRWQHPTKGLLLPIDFIPLAEASGLIIPLGEWILKTACQKNKEWQNMGLPFIRVAVNVTTKQFKQYNFVDNIKTILEQTRLEPKYLELELTENVIINNMDIISTLHSLKNLGVQIALDGLGTSYSSLTYLNDIHVDRFKIDQSFVQNAETDRSDDVMIQAIIAMAQSLNLDVLSEGIETQHQLDFLKKYKCGLVQGFTFSKAMSSNDCEQLLKESDTLNLIDAFSNDKA